MDTLFWPERKLIQSFSNSKNPFNAATRKYGQIFVFLWPLGDEVNAVPLKISVIDLLLKFVRYKPKFYLDRMISHELAGRCFKVTSHLRGCPSEKNSYARWFQ